MTAEKTISIASRLLSLSDASDVLKKAVLSDPGKFVIKSTSDEGIYYLVNGWNKHNSFWLREISYKTTFKRKQDATRSINHLLEIMPDYRSDRLELIEVDI